MKLYFDNEEFDGQFGRTVGYTSAGGADIGECWATAATIKPGDADSWYDAWIKLGDRLYASAVASLDAGNRVSARSAFWRASNYYRNAYIVFFAIPVDPRVETAYDKQHDAFLQSLPLFGAPAEPIKIPFEGTTLPGYFFPATTSTEPRPLLIMTGGYDGTCEEVFFAGGHDALRRGYNVLAFDGPGQGGVLVKQKIYMRPDWENVVTPVVDYALTRSDVDPKRIALIGRSFGGYLAPRAASAEHRLAACIADAVVYDLGASAKKMIPKPIMDLIEARNELLLKPIFDMMMHSPGVRFSMDRGMWVHGVPTPWDYILEMKNYSLVGLGSKIQCPTFLSEAEDDSRRGGGPILYQELTCPKKYVLFKAADGAGDHCEAGAGLLFAQTMFDWLDPILKP